MNHHFNPKKHPYRSIRLKGYDYAQSGAYFITICGYRRKHWFGEIKNGTMSLNAFGRIADREWQSLPERFPQISTAEYVIMPNHMHGILLVAAPLAGALSAPILNIEDASGLCELNNNDGFLEHHLDMHPDDLLGRHPQGVRLQGRGAEHLGEIVGAYKSLVADKCLELFIKHRPGKIMGKLWQRNYWEHIIRNEIAYHNIANYILNNPHNWKKDHFSPK